jgi:hypothetical protein
MLSTICAVCTLPFFAAYCQDFITRLNERVKKLYKRDTSLMFQDVTNYFWEIDCPAPDISRETERFVLDEAAARCIIP